MMKLFSYFFVDSMLSDHLIYPSVNIVLNELHLTRSNRPLNLDNQSVVAVKVLLVFTLQFRWPWCKLLTLNNLP